jgi:DGQHR domain-containing protein
MKKSNDKLIVRALRTFQAGNVEVYSFFAPGQLIMELAEISRIYRDETEKLEGFQRKEIKNHVNRIVEYLDQGEVLFPNSLILAFSREVEFKQARGKDPDGVTDIADIGTLIIPIREEGQKVAWIVDGQQRSLALSKTKNASIPVPVVAFVAPDLETQRAQFILVNKAKPLPTRLINELLPEVDTHLPKDLSIKKIPSELCNLLNLDPSSPFYHLIERESIKGAEAHSQGMVNDTAIMEIIRKSLTNPLGALAPFKGIGTETADTEGMYQTLVLFWGTVKEVFPEAWGIPPTESRLMHGAGIKAMGVLMDRIMARIPPSSEPRKEIKASLKAIAPNCAWTKGVWRGLGIPWNEIQNVTSHIRALSDYLVKLDFENSHRKTV